MTRRPNPLIMLAVAAAVLVIISTGLGTVALVRVGHLVDRIQEERAATVEGFCEALNDNVGATNRLNDYFRAIIVGGAKTSRVFEDLYRAHGAPPYTVRLRQAERTAAGISQRDLRRLDCDELVARIRATN